MVNQSSIKYISSLLNNPETITSGDQSSIALFRQTFPFFVPVRYLAAVEKNKQAPYSNEMLAEIQPYMGDWILFCDFLQAGARTKDKVLDKKKVDVSLTSAHPETESPVTPVSPLVKPLGTADKPTSSYPAAAKNGSQVAPEKEDRKDDTTNAGKEKPPFAVPPQLPELEILDVDAVTFELEQEDTATPGQLKTPAEPVAESESPPIAAEPKAEPQATPEINESKAEAIIETIAVAAAQPDDAPKPVQEAIKPETTIETPVETPLAAAPGETTIEEAQLAEVHEDAAAAAHTVSPDESRIPDIIVLPSTPVTATESTIPPEAHEIVEAEPAMDEKITGQPIEVFTYTIPTLDIPESKDPLISPVYTQDYFLQQGEKISEEIPAGIDELVNKEEEDEAAKSLMVMMSFSEWLLHFKNTSEKQQEEKKDQKALKTMWQKEKLAAAMEEENEEIPESVFQMAVNSITKEEDLASEPLANIYIKQGRYDQAIEMYRKLSLRNPQKSTYFARKIEEIQKGKS